MNKTIFISLFILCITLFAEFNFSDAILISDSNINPIFAYPVDIDGDGDDDLITISGGDNIVGWFENQDGMGNFGVQHIITDDYNIPASVEAADLDNDQDMDIVVSFYQSDMLIWFRNTDGAGNFELAQIIASDRDGAFGISVGDVDNDDDIDILMASWEDDTLCWYRNTDGLGNFTLAQIIDDNAAKACRIITADLDTDGDLDAIAATNFTEDKIYWFENTDGSGNFEQSQIITTNVQNVLSICISDIDNDDDLDILSASTDDNKAAWYANTDGNIGSQQIISSSAEDAFHISTADLDNDGDEDVIVSCGVAGRIEVFENLGNSTFGTTQVISTTAPFVHSTLPADLDGDGNLDLVSTFWSDNKIVWFRNEHITSASDELHNSIPLIKDFMNHPNPFNPSTTISYQLTKQSDVEMSIYNLKGQKIKTLIDNSFEQGNHSVIWNGTEDLDKPVSSGIYFYKLNVNSKAEVVKKCLLLK
ncbi:MAG: FG-GAP-like repeat-containing protein [Candidatus Cloacimonetes bacterium]|nr:FG-GAP-like repeat-containing protein [Candidatus Cloacimonadota bacterium]